MDAALGALAFAALMLAHVLAVIFIRHDETASKAAREAPSRQPQPMWNEASAMIERR